MRQETYIPRHAMPETPGPTAKPKPRPSRRRKRRARRILRRAAIALLLIALVLGGALLARRLLVPDALRGVWTLENTTVYAFDGRGHGELRLPLNTYAFRYTFRDGALHLSFADPALGGADYAAAREDGALRLETGDTAYLLRLADESPSYNP